jgi:hypothetical protein
MIMHLTGSRFFGNAREDSDYDYLAEYSKENLAELENAGYAIKGVFLHGPNETIILVKDINKYLEARENLLHLPLKDYPRWQHGYLWKMELQRLGG